MSSRYCDALHEEYTENVKLLYTDTDRFDLHTKTKDAF